MAATASRSTLLAATLSLWLLACAHAPAIAAPGKIALATRQVTIFTRMETDLDRAVAAHDANAVDAMVSPDFELRSGLDPTGSTTRADWLTATAAGDIEQMSVHEHGTLSVASFVRTTGGERFYVVDVWERQGDAWRLLTRYQSPLPPAEPAEEDTPPTGKG